jgi:hypothetical protein
MNLRFALVLVIPCLLATACGKQWTKPGATVEEIQADIEACELLAAEQFPVAMSSTDTSNRKEYETRCTNHGNQTNCTTRSSDTGGSYQHDRNEEERRQAASQCMVSRGYIK